MPEVAPAVAQVIGLTAYRIMQESLSNAARHASGAPISVSVREAAGVILVSVVNGPGQSHRPDVANAPGSPGHGLRGMRERVALLGGRLRTGPEAGGGFAVRAELPARLPVTSLLADEGQCHGVSR